jgi:uncharacterized protein (UPF0332 family)
MTFDWSEYLRLARTLAQDSRDDAARRSAVSRAYYAAFHKARAFNAQKQLWCTCGQARGSHEVVWHALKDSGNADWRRVGNWGLDFKEKRRKVDYDDEIADMQWMIDYAFRTAGNIIKRLS